MVILVLTKQDGLSKVLGEQVVMLHHNNWFHPVYATYLAFLYFVMKKVKKCCICCKPDLSSHDLNKTKKFKFY